MNEQKDDVAPFIGSFAFLYPLITVVCYLILRWAQRGGTGLGELVFETLALYVFAFAYVALIFAGLLCYLVCQFTPRSYQILTTAAAGFLRCGTGVVLMAHGNATFSYVFGASGAIAGAVLAYADSRLNRSSNADPPQLPADINSDSF